MIGAPSVEAYIYIYHLGVKFNLPVLPESLTDSMSVNFAQEPVLGRSAPQMTFTAAGPRTVAISIKVHRHLFALENPEIETQLKHRPRKRLGTGGDILYSMLDAKAEKQYTMKMANPLTGNMEEVTCEDAMDYLINGISSLAYPKYLDAAKAIVPPSVLIRYGNEVSIRGVPTSFTKSSSGPWLKSGKQAEVTLSFTVIETEPYSAQFVAQYGGLRDVSVDLTRSGVWGY